MLELLPPPVSMVGSWRSRDAHPVPEAPPLLPPVMLASLHYMSMRLLRGSVAEAQDAIASVKDPRRISAFDIAMLWVLVALAARHFE